PSVTRRATISRSTGTRPRVTASRPYGGNLSLPGHADNDGPPEAADLPSAIAPGNLECPPFLPFVTQAARCGWHAPPGTASRPCRVPVIYTGAMMGWGQPRQCAQGLHIGDYPR